MSSGPDRLAAIQAIYLDAMSNETSDLSKATTNVAVAAVQSNLSNAQLTYYTAAAEALTANSQEVEDALAAAKTALDGVTKARNSAASFATLLGSLTSATSAATNLLNLAKAV